MSTMRYLVTPASLAVTLVQLAVSGPAPVSAQEPGPDPRGCSTPEELEARRSKANVLSKSDPSPGYHGIIYSFDVSATPGEGPTLDNPPVVDAIPCESPAHRSGLRPGDVIVAVDDTELTGGVPLMALGSLTAKRAGMTFHLEVARGGDTLSIELTSVPRPEHARP